MEKGQKFFYSGFAALSAVFLLSAAVISVLPGKRSDSIFAAAEPEEIRIVVDAGHGGEDGGCVSEDGVLEKDINLEVAKKVSEILSVMGYSTVMTRTEDKMLYDMYGDNAEGRKKTYDLKNRLRFAEENGADMFVSIHMNKFPEEKYSGLQVYYSKNCPESRQIASVVQSFNKSYLQKDNEREIKEAGKNIYVMDRIKIPAVLVECGFLSNETEKELLVDDKYRKELGFTVAAALASYMEVDKN